MWKNKSFKRYYWAGIGEEFKKLANEMTQVEAEEGGDLFLLQMHLRSKSEMSVFDEEERKQIEHLLSLLIEDSKRHERTLGRISNVLDSYWQGMSSS